MKKLRAYATSTFREIMGHASANPEAFENKTIENKYNSLTFNSRGELVRIQYFEDKGITEDTEFMYSYLYKFDYNTAMSVLVAKRKTDGYYENHFNKSIDDLLKEEVGEELQTIHTPNELGQLIMIWNEKDGLVGEE